MGVDLHTQVKERFPSKEALVWIRSLPSSGSQLSERLSVCSCQFVFTLSVESLLKLGEDKDRLLWRRTLMKHYAIIIVILEAAHLVFLLFSLHVSFPQIRVVTQLLKPSIV